MCALLVVLQRDMKKKRASNDYAIFGPNLSIE